MRLTSIGLLVFCALVVIGIALVSAHFAMENNYDSGIIDLDMPAQPGIWDSAAFIAVVFFELFIPSALPTAPLYVTLIIWIFTILGNIALVYLIRGSS